MPLSPGPDPFELLRACRTLFERRLTEIVKQSGIGTPAVLEAFSHEIGEAHDQLASSRPVDGFEETDDLTASRLTLMGDDDLELDIRIREIGTRLRAAGGKELRRSQLRYMSLLHRPLMPEAGNPVGPEVICQGLWVIGRQCAKIDDALGALAAVEAVLGPQLPLLYREIEQLLAREGVESAPVQQAPNKPGARPWVAPADASQQDNPISNLQQLVRQRLDPQAADGEAAGAEAGGRTGNAALDAAAVVMLNHLLDRLTALESRSGGAATRTGVHPDAPEAADAAPLRALNSGDLHLPLGQPEAICLDTMALIFEAIFASAELPNTIKTAIARLQIPLLKLAIVDSDLIANTRHPARLLINRMARAAIGLPRNVDWEHPVCQRIGAVTAAVRKILDSPLLEPYLAELEALTSERDETVRQGAAAHVQLVTEHESRQQAEQLAQAWLVERLARTRAPEIADFLEHYWCRVMLAAALAGGKEGTHWQQASATGDELIWSVEPKTSAEERKRLAGMASSLVRRIGAGLDALGVDRAERSPFLNSLFDLQTAALRTQTQILASPSAAPSRRTASAGTAAKTGPRMLVRREQRVHYLVRADESRSTLRAAAPAWRVGDWLRFRASQQEPLCGLCCWQSASSATLVLFNPDWGYAVAMSPAALDEQLRAGEAQVVSRIALFDAAAESALALLERR